MIYPKKTRQNDDDTFTLQIQNLQSLRLNCCHWWTARDSVPRMINITNGMTYLGNLSAQTRLLHIKQYPMTSLTITIRYIPHRML